MDISWSNISTLFLPIRRFVRENLSLGCGCLPPWFGLMTNARHALGGISLTRCPVTWHLRMLSGKQKSINH